jgi:hypothetical protein
MPELLAKVIRYVGREVVVACDAKCYKAWGKQKRPVMSRFGDGSPRSFVLDGDLGMAPKDPRTAEGPDSKPRHAEDRLNRWCVRECERCAMFGEFGRFELPQVWERTPT